MAVIEEEVEEVVKGDDCEMGERYRTVEEEKITKREEEKA